MLKVRVIPTLLWKGSGLVKGTAFNSWRRVGTVLPAIKVYNSRDVDELVLVDIVATDERRDPEYEAISDFADECSVPFTVGGGINRLDQIASLLRSGADKICINSAAFSTPELIDNAASLFGSQCIVASIDVRRDSIGGCSVFSHSGKSDTKRDPVSWAIELASRGAGEILLTSIDRDGTMVGYDLPLIESITLRVDVPVIASGGAGTYQHMVEAIKEAGASAVAAASMFHFTEQTPDGAKQAMDLSGIPIRRRFLAL